MNKETYIEYLKNGQLSNWISDENGNPEQSFKDIQEVINAMFEYKNDVAVTDICKKPIHELVAEFLLSCSKKAPLATCTFLLSTSGELKTLQEGNYNDLVKLIQNLKEHYPNLLETLILAIPNDTKNQNFNELFKKYWQKSAILFPLKEHTTLLKLMKLDPSMAKDLLTHAAKVMGIKTLRELLCGPTFQSLLEKDIDAGIRRTLANSIRHVLSLDYDPSIIIDDYGVQIFFKQDKDSVEFEQVVKMAGGLSGGTAQKLSEPFVYDDGKNKISYPFARKLSHESFINLSFGLFAIHQNVLSVQQCVMYILENSAVKKTIQYRLLSLADKIPKSGYTCDARIKEIEFFDGLNKDAIQQYIKDNTLSTLWIHVNSDEQMLQLFQLVTNELLFTKNSWPINISLSQLFVDFLVTGSEKAPVVALSMLLGLGTIRGINKTIRQEITDQLPNIIKKILKNMNNGSDLEVLFEHSDFISWDKLDRSDFIKLIKIYPYDKLLIKALSILSESNNVLMMREVLCTKEYRSSKSLFREIVSDLMGHTLSLASTPYIMFNKDKVELLFDKENDCEVVNTFFGLWQDQEAIGVRAKLKEPLVINKIRYNNKLSLTHEKFLWIAFGLYNLDKKLLKSVIENFPSDIRKKIETIQVEGIIVKQKLLEFIGKEIQQKFNQCKTAKEKEQFILSCLQKDREKEAMMQFFQQEKLKITALCKEGPGLFIQLLEKKSLTTSQAVDIISANNNDETFIKKLKEKATFKQWFHLRNDLKLNTLFNILWQKDSNFAYQCMTTSYMSNTEKAVIVKYHRNSTDFLEKLTKQLDWLDAYKEGCYIKNFFTGFSGCISPLKFFSHQVINSELSFNLSNEQVLLCLSRKTPEELEDSGFDFDRMKEILEKDILAKPEVSALWDLLIEACMYYGALQKQGHLGYGTFFGQVDGNKQTSNNVFDIHFKFEN